MWRRFAQDFGIGKVPNHRSVDGVFGKKARDPPTAAHAKSWVLRCPQAVAGRQSVVELHQRRHGGRNSG